MGYVIVGGVLALVSFMAGVIVTTKLSKHFVDNFVTKLSPDDVVKMNKSVSSPYKENYADEEKMSLSMSDEEYTEYLRSRKEE